MVTRTSRFSLREKPRERKGLEATGEAGIRGILGERLPLFRPFRTLFSTLAARSTSLSISIISIRRRVFLQCAIHDDLFVLRDVVPKHFEIGSQSEQNNTGNNIPANVKYKN